jgi:hypothetical protein
MGVGRTGVAQPVDRCSGVDAGAPSRLFDDEIDGALGQRAAWPPDGLKHGRERPRMATAGKETGGDHRRDGARTASPLMKS